MRSAPLSTFLALLWLFGICGAEHIAPNDPDFVYIGRFDSSNQSSYRFDWSGVQISANFQGTSLRVYLWDEKESSIGQNEFNVFIDGGLTVLSLTYGKMDGYLVASGLSDGPHQLLITKRTEALFLACHFEGLQLDDGCYLVSPPARKQRKIEFIGDSITCGFGNLGTPPCPFQASTENNWQSWGPVLAQTLNAEYYLEAWSGMGMVRNYNDPNTTSKVPFPALYPQTLGSDRGTKWDFTQWKPDAIVINLGTNDYSTQPQPPRAVFEAGYRGFLRNLRTWYGETLPVFAVCGPMIGNPCCQYVKEVAALEAANQVYYIDMQGILQQGDYGCAGHPNVSGDAKMAATALPIVKKVMGW